MSQPPRDFRTVQTQGTTNQPPRQFRPTFSKLPADAPPYIDTLKTEMETALRQTIDNVQGQRAAFGPLNLFSAGMGDPLKVPVGATDSNYGSGLGLFVTLQRAGNWLLTAAVTLNIVGDSGELFTLTLQNGQITQPLKALAQSASNGTFSMHQTWQIASKTGDDLCRLLIKKAGGSGTSNVDVQHSSLTALWQGT